MEDYTLYPIVRKLKERVAELEDSNRLLVSTLGVTIGGLLVLAAVMGIWCWKTTQTIENLVAVVNQITDYINAGGLS